MTDNTEQEANQSKQNSDLDQPDYYVSRSRLTRNLLLFQFKLALDGLRDLLLSPISLLIGFYEILFAGARRGKQFNALLGFGHKTDSWINLFNLPQENSDGLPASSDKSADALFSHIERAVKTEMEQRKVLPKSEQNTNALENKHSQP